jgi:hypothetical protein
MEGRTMRSREVAQGAQAPVKIDSAQKRAESSEDDGSFESKQELLLFRQKCIALFHDNFQSGIEGLRFLFSPCWDSKRSRITSFACGEFDTPTSPGLFECCGLTGAVAQCEIDVMALAAAARGVREIRSHNELAFVTVPVHCETLAWAKTRAAYFAVLSQVEPSFLPFLSPRITGFRQGHSLYAAAPWLTEFRRYVRWTFVQLPLLNFDFSNVLALGATGFGISIAVLRPNGSPPEVLRAQLEKFVNICARQTAIACVNEVESLQDLHLLKSCGVWVISGPVIGQSSESPGSVQAASFVPNWPDQLKKHAPLSSGIST